MLDRSPRALLHRADSSMAQPTPWRWLEPHEALDCLREHGVRAISPETPLGLRTAPAERRVDIIAMAFLRFAWHHPLPATRYRTQLDPTQTQDWWATVLVQQHSHGRRAIACMTPWDVGHVLHPDGRAAFTLKAFPKVLMAQTGQAFAEAPVHDSMVNAFVDVAQDLADGALEQAWCARESIQLRQTLSSVPSQAPGSAPVPRRRL